MAGFSVIGQPVRTFWFPVDYNAVTLYEGQLCAWSFQDSDEGISAYNVAGLADTTADQAPLGVILGFNNRNPVFNTTYKANYGTSVSTVAAQLARESVMVEGKMWKNDPALMAHVAIIDNTTILKGRIFNAAYGTAPAVITNTAADATGATITTAALTYTMPAYNTMFYCRSGANMGLYRPGYAASTTAHTFHLCWPYGLAVGDTFVGCALTLGQGKACFDAVGTYIEQYGADNATTYGTNYIWVDMFEINLATAGNESAIFRINAAQFLPVART
jgi:hypothetical protein